ncbi:P1 family peptidase [Thomasclavelia cocleata]|uniref:P1 family peptidase n=1 Tax=Thomasclavelia cocleata TaxID=69824 RepID=UPI00272C7F1F|nr:P1 family peptidase [Thomasclavelia cocleata]
MKEIKITDIKGIQIGQAENQEAGTGCTVIICKEGATAGVDVRGGGPATRETDLLNPINMVQQINAIMLSGGSAFGLDAASGAMQYLEERNYGFDMKVAHVPIVCSASLFDLTVGNPKIRPDKEMGYQACLNSETNESIKEGNYGAGCGASVGKIMGPQYAMKGGIGTSAVQIDNIQVGAIVAVNACGNVVDYKTNEQLAGIYDQEHNCIIPADEVIFKQIEKICELPNGNTTIGCVITNVKLDKAQCTKIAGIAHNGYARAIHPVHTMSDGDTIFVLSTNEVEIMPDAVGILATEMIAKAINNAIKAADSAYGLKSYKELHD